MITVILHSERVDPGIIGTMSELVTAASEGVVRDVVLVTSERTDFVEELLDSTGAECEIHSGSRAERLTTAGFRQVRGSWLLFLEAGVRLEPGWHLSASDFIERSIKGGRHDLVATFRYQSPISSLAGKLDEFAFRMRTRTLGLPSPDQGMLIDRNLYKHIGGHRDFGSLTDADLWKRIGGSRLSHLNSSIKPLSGDAAEGRKSSFVHMVKMALVCLRFPPSMVAKML